MISHHSVPTKLAALLLCITLAACSVPTLQKPAANPTAAAEQIANLVSYMQQDVLAGRREAYLAHVDLSDPIFAIEHQRWVDGWMKQPPKSFRLSIEKLAFDSNSATGRLTMSWTTKDNPGALTASFPVQFHADSHGAWRYAGEAWTTTEVEHFRIKAWPETEDTAVRLTTDLPKIYQHVTTSLNYQPSHSMEIKLYSSETALIANTLLDLPHARGWNEPGESLKLTPDSNDPLLDYGIAHEFTHYIEFEWAGNAHSRWPWWLSEGLAVFTGSYFEPSERIEARMSRVREAAANNRLLSWNSISDFEKTPAELWPQVYAQGYAFVKYTTEIYGTDRRNEWLRKMAKEMDLEQASQTILNASFGDLDAHFKAWLRSS